MRGELWILNWAQATSLRQRGEWKGKNDAEVSIDYPHYGFDKDGKWNTGHDVPHVGWQVGKKTSKKVGHILLDDVPAGRPKKKDSNCSLWK